MAGTLDNQYHGDGSLGDRVPTSEVIGLHPGQYHGGGPLGDRSLSNTPIDSALLCPGPGLHGDSQTMMSQVRVPTAL
jgi:hypothetical protein